MKNIFTSPKTTLVGISIFVLIVLYLIKIIETERFLTVTAFLISIGFIAAKDNDKTGTN